MAVGPYTVASWDTQGSLCMLLDSRCLYPHSLPSFPTSSSSSSSLSTPSLSLLLSLFLSSSSSSLSLSTPSLSSCHPHPPPPPSPPLLPSHCLPLHHPDNTEIVIPPKHHVRNRKAEIGYYKIARHYKWALTQVFEKMNNQYAIIVEGN